MTERRAEGASELWFGGNDVLYSRRISGIICATGYSLRGTAKRGMANDWEGATGRRGGGSARLNLSDESELQRNRREVA